MCLLRIVSSLLSTRMVSVILSGDAPNHDRHLLPF
jgi:hypothetical protein